MNTAPPVICERWFINHEITPMNTSSFISTIFSHWNKATVHAIDWGPHPVVNDEKNQRGRTMIWDEHQLTSRYFKVWTGVLIGLDGPQPSEPLEMLWMG